MIDAIIAIVVGLLLLYFGISSIILFIKNVNKNDGIWIIASALICSIGLFLFGGGILQIIKIILP